MALGSSWSFSLQLVLPVCGVLSESLVSASWLKLVIQSTVTTSCLWCLESKTFLCVHKNRVVSIVLVQLHFHVSLSSDVVSFVVSYVVSTLRR